MRREEEVILHGMGISVGMGYSITFNGVMDRMREDTEKGLCRRMKGDKEKGIEDKWESVSEWLEGGLWKEKDEIRETNTVNITQEMH